VSDDTRFPYGYARPPGGGPMGMGTMLTFAEMMTKSTVFNLHPEVQRRFHALIEAASKAGVPLGVGTGWRVQPNPPPKGFAQPGNSWHESCPVAPTSQSALAIDTVPEPSWNWMEQNCAAYGLRTFRNVNNEPWHIQPAEIPAGRNFATTLPPIQTWELPGDEDMPLTDDDIKKIANQTADAVWAKAFDTTGKEAQVEPQPARYLLQRTFLICQQYLGSYGGKPMDTYRPSWLKQILDAVKK
jgi:hypothetical protein